MSQKKLAEAVVGALNALSTLADVAGDILLDEVSITEVWENHPVDVLRDAALDASTALMEALEDNEIRVRFVREGGFWVLVPEGEA